MNLIYANEDEKLSGWTLSVEFLKKVRDAAHKYEKEDASLETIESILIALYDINWAKREGGEMREIKFRAKDKANNEWVYGNLETPLLDWSISKRYIVGYSYGQYQKHEVEPETVGQYTGIKDIYDVDIYEGDINKGGYVVTYVDGSDESDIEMNVGFYIQRNDFESWTQLEVGAMYEVVGNIHDNPELVEVNQ